MPFWATERPVAITPTLLRRSTSRRSRTTEKLVLRAGAGSDSSSSPVWALTTPRLKRPGAAGHAAADFERHDAAPFRPMRRL